MILLNMFLTIFCAYIAGQLHCSIDVDRLEDRKVPWYRYALVACNLMASLLNLIVCIGSK
jgi:hypothetical protein